MFGNIKGKITKDDLHHLISKADRGKYKVIVENGNPDLVLLNMIKR